MKRKVIIMILLTSLLSTNVFATELELQKNTKLPKLELPKQEQLKEPKLQSNFDELINELKLEGLDKYKYDKNNLEDSIPTVETPKNKGKKAEEAFKEKFGDMWKDKPLKREDKSPSNKSIKNYRENFARNNDKSLNNLKTKDKNKLSKYLSKELDTSNLFDLSSIKRKTSVSSSNSIPSCSKPKGFGSNLSNPPSKGEWLSKAKNRLPSDFGKKKGIGNSISNLPIIGEAIDNIKSIWNNTKKYKNEATTRKNKGGKATTKDKSWLKNTLKKNFKAVW